MTAFILENPVGVEFEPMDTEHQFQVELVSALQQALEQGSGQAEIDEILDNLISYTDAHFTAEQLLMRFYGYPLYAAHLQEHDRLMEQVRELRERFRAGDAKLALQTSASLRSWLLNHIRGLDQALGTFLKQQPAGV